MNSPWNCRVCECAAIWQHRIAQLQRRSFDNHGGFSETIVADCWSTDLRRVLELTTSPELKEHDERDHHRHVDYEEGFCRLGRSAGGRVESLGLFQPRRLGASDPGSQPGFPE